MKRVLPLLLLLFSLKAWSQDRCGYDVINQRLLKNNPQREQQRFENWLQKNIEARQKKSAQLRTQAGPYQIPVVVHVIHNGEPVGTGTNISDAQIASQISVLNKDYKRLNADAVNTPALFQSVAGSIDLQFVLAKQDPDGLPTNGIVRVKGAKAGWTTADEFFLKSQSYWPAENYMNIWVVNETDSFIGYAQFPVSSLNGLADAPTERLTDGVVIDYKVFGSVDDGAFNLDTQYNKGRTTTHEVGHFLGLLHTFEGGCSTQNDYVTDTPPLSDATRNCPSHPATSCSGTKMFQNYLDYTDDACMNLFTNGQVSRMTTVLENSPRRLSLLTSPGLTAPVIFAVDAEAKLVISPAANTCSIAQAPKLEIRNRGNTTITSIRASLTVNGTLKETKDYTINLAPFNSDTLAFQPLALAEPSTNNIQFSINLVNGSTDSNTSNNNITSTSTVLARLTPPVAESFNSSPTNWTIQNSDNGITWQNVTAPAASSSNTSMYLNFYDYEQESYKDYLVSPYIDLTQATAAILKFDRAYARFPGKNLDSLRVRVYTDCQSDPTSSFTIFNAGGTALATANDQGVPFTPSSQSSWKTEAISLAPYLGKNIQLVFEATNGYGNNLYLDNIQVATGSINDIALTGVNGPGAVICIDSPKPELTVQNLGSAAITRLTITPTVNGQAVAEQLFTNLNIVSGGAVDLTLNSITLTNGSNTVQFTVSNPDAPADELPANNTFSYTWVVNDTHETVPLRQQMEDLAGWTTVAQGSQQNWETVSTNLGKSLKYAAFTNTSKGQQATLATPVLDFSTAIKSSVLFDVSYGKKSNGNESLNVFSSDDCGLTYNKTIYTQSGDLLALGNSNQAWIPKVESDWRSEYINLNEFAGKDNIRLAFVVTNDNGNNLYLDNIEFFVDDDPSPPKIGDLYAVYSSDTDPYDFKVTFKLPEKETARIQVYSILGQLMIDETLPETLNQTYTVNLNGNSSGIYIARLQLGALQSSFKLWVGR